MASSRKPAPTVPKEARTIQTPTKTVTTSTGKKTEVAVSTPKAANQPKAQAPKTVNQPKVQTPSSATLNSRNQAYATQVQRAQSQSSTSSPKATAPKSPAPKKPVSPETKKVQEAANNVGKSISGLADAAGGWVSTKADKANKVLTDAYNNAKDTVVRTATAARDYAAKVGTTIATTAYEQAEAQRQGMEQVGQALAGATAKAGNKVAGTAYGVGYAVVEDVKDSWKQFKGRLDTFGNNMSKGQDTYNRQHSLPTVPQPTAGGPELGG